MRLVLLILLLSSCVTQRVQDRTLIPAIESAWPGVRADADLGGMQEIDLLEIDSQIASGALYMLDIERIESAALVGIDLRLVAGEVGPIGANVLRDRARSFRKAVEEATRVVLVSAPRDYAERPLVISSSSWATSPPSAIAARTYR
tara:strand:+ start:4639 stop:5076 length:438 start_codon:yes stop_codon:yes gene_type:complete